MNRYGKWSRSLSLVSVLAMGFYCLLAWYLFYRYNQLFDAGYTSLDVSMCGSCMQYFIWFGAGLAGSLFIGSADDESRVHRAGVWGVLQCLTAWALAYPAAFLGKMNDGSGLMFIFFAPLATHPSFAVALILGMSLNISKRPESYFRPRLFCFLVILAFMVITFSAFLSVEIVAAA